MRVALPSHYQGETIVSTQRYLFIRRGAPGKQEQPSSAQMQEMYAAFEAWQRKFKTEIADMGGRLKGGGKVVRASGVTDGPFTEAKELVGGFMIVAAESYERAVQVASEMPGMTPGASIEIREIA
jgi:hypothetical protein